MSTVPSNPTWEDLVRAEPRLARLQEDVAAADRLTASSSFCAVCAWHGSGGRPGLKTRMYRLAGFGSSNPDLRTRRAYEVALETLYASLPPAEGALAAKRCATPGKQVARAAPFWKQCGLVDLKVRDAGLRSSSRTRRRRL